MDNMLDYQSVSHKMDPPLIRGGGGGRVVRWCWVNFQCPGILLIWIRVEQGPTALAVDAGGVVWTFCFLSSIISLFFFPLRYRLKYSLKGPVSPNNQPTRFFGLSDKTLNQGPYPSSLTYSDDQNSDLIYC